MQSLLRCIIIVFGLFFGLSCGDVFAPWGRSNADMRKVDPLEPEQVKSIKGISEFQKLLSALQTKMKSVQASMTKVEKKHRIEEETAFWMIFRYIISNLEYECDYFIRFTKELSGNMSKYERQARKESVDETIINNVQLELNNFCCLGHKVNLACIRGVFAVMLQYIESEEIDEGEKAALEPIISQKHLAILSKNKDLFALAGNVVGKIPTFLDSLNAVSEVLPKDGGTDEGYSEKFKVVTDSLESILTALQDAITYVRGGIKADEIKAHRDKLIGDLITNSQRMGIQRVSEAANAAVQTSASQVSAAPLKAPAPQAEDDEDEEDSDTENEEEDDGGEENENGGDAEEGDGAEEKNNTEEMNNTKGKNDAEERDGDGDDGDEDGAEEGDDEEDDDEGE